MPAKKAENAVAKVEEKTTALVLGQAEADMLVESAGEGSEDFSREDLALPFLRILQALSPQVTRGDEQYVKGAAAGMFFETMNREFHDGEEVGVLFVPCFYTMSYTEWHPRDEGGGFVADHGSDSRILQQTHRSEKGWKDLMPGGTEILTAAMYYGLLIDPNTGEPRQVLLSLSSTQLKKSKRWNSQIASMTVPDPRNPSKRLRPPMYYSAWRLRTVPEKNDQGNWFGLSLQLESPVFQLEGGRDIFLMAKGFRDAVAQGTVKVDRSGVRDGGSSEGMEDAEVSTGVVDDDLPF